MENGKQKRRFIDYLDHRIVIIILILFAVSAITCATSFFLFLLFLPQGGYVFVPIVCFLVYIIIGVFIYRWAVLPYRETSKLLRLFADGYMVEDVFRIRCPHSTATDEAIMRVQEMMKTDMLVSASKRQAQYLALQNQINPHFLYNTLEGIRSDALAAGLSSVAKMSEALGTFFRYTISNVERLVSLEEELLNVENYFIIQKYRFGDRISLNVNFDSDDDRSALLKCKLPKLTLQPIIENAIVHGIEGKIGSGEVVVKVLATGERVIITVSDNGVGIEGAVLKSLNQKLNSSIYDYIDAESDGQSGIALVNVNNRIRLLFGEAYGLIAYSTVGVGTDVEITLPHISESEEE
ncbi:MAG: histidine kinase [Oscillospiraceae bacterium]|nr:histidine kinase [Oscillospiraceae bacterium]